MIHKEFIPDISESVYLKKQLVSLIQMMVDMTTEHHMNDILAIHRYHMIYTIPYRHSVMRFNQV